MKTPNRIAKSAVAVLTALAFATDGADAATIVPLSDVNFTPVGTLLAIDSPISSGDTRTDIDGFSIASGSIGGYPNNAGLYWAPSGSLLNNQANGIFTVGGSFLFTFDIPNGSTVNNVYTRWRAQSNQTSNAVYSYSEGLDTASVSYDQRNNEAGSAGFRWTSSDTIPVISGFFTYQNLFGSSISVADGDGFKLTVDASVSGATAFGDGNTSKVLRLDAVIIDYTPVPEPSAALLGSLGVLTLLRRRRH